MAQAETLFPELAREERRERARLRRFAKRRIAAYRSTEPCDEALAEERLRDVYRAAMLEEPEEIIWWDSPFGLASREGAEVERVDPVRFQAYLNPTSALVGLQLGLAWSLAARETWDYLRKTVVRATWGRILNPYVALRSREWGHSYSGEDRWDSWAVAGPFSFYALYYDRKLIPLGERLFRALDAVSLATHGMILRRTVAVLIRRPVRLSFDAEGRLHNEAGQAIEYRDGSGCSFWHGFAVPDRYIRDPDSIAREDIVGAKNVEVRRVMWEILGGQAFARRMHLVEVDRAADPGGIRPAVLYETPGPERWAGEVLKYVKVMCPSTGRPYVLGVPPTVQTAGEALAWTFGKRTEEYRPQAAT